MLYEKDTYTNKKQQLLISKQIFEYDIKSANTSICREYELLPLMVIEDLEKMDKIDRVVAFGKYMRGNDKLKYEFKAALSDIRKVFFTQNDLTDDDIVSIKKDAIFTTKPCINTQFGYCNFVEKDRYSSALFLHRYELYYNKDKLDIKGISNNSYERLDTIINWLKELFSVMETIGISNALVKAVNLFDSYKRKELDDGFYVSFNSTATLIFQDIDQVAEDADNIDVLDITFNLEHLLIPIIEILMKSYKQELIKNTTNNKR